jgi:hypothetical protein
MPSTSDADLRAFLAEVVNVPSSRIEKFEGTVLHMRELLSARVASGGEYALEEILSSGSVAKKTAIHPLADMDVAVYLRPEQVPARDIPRVLDYVRGLLREMYPLKDEADFSPGRFAVRVRFREQELDVDVVPVIPNGGPDRAGAVINRHTGEWVNTSIPAHVRFIRECAGEHPNFRELVRLTKWWRREREVRFKSFLIELLWAHVLREELVAGAELGEAMLGFFAYIIRSGLREPISFPAADGTRPEPPRDATVVVLDPVNPVNNVAAGMDAAQREALVAACRYSLENLASAQTAATRPAARGYYQRVFGPHFPLSCTPDEAAAPHDAAREVAAKIHSDLRQLRVLHGGFAAAYEEQRAADLYSWIAAGHAQVIEAGYYDPSTRERRFAIAYEVKVNGRSPAGDEPGGLTGTFGGGEFRINITVSERWRTLASKEQEAFYRTLSGGWGPAEPIPVSPEPWQPDRTYAGGSLDVTRSLCRPRVQPANLSL